MGEHDVLRLARDVVDAFNENDWDRSRAQLMEPGAVYLS